MSARSTSGETGLDARRVALAGYDIADDGLASEAHHVGKNFRELDVHVQQRLPRQGEYSHLIVL